jgi:16S rRNA U516 pseudouridylate synthase RsuA-like enzyme
MIIESVELISLPGAPSYQEKIYQAHMDTGEEVFLFQAHWDVPLPPESLVGLTVEEAKQRRVERMLAAAGLHG